MLEKKGGSCHAVPVQRPAGAHEIYYPLEPDALHPGRISQRAHLRYRPAGPHALPDRTAVHRHALPPQAVAALYHDAPEIITGDMPTPVKYSSPTLRDAYKALETESVRCMTGLLPDELSEELSPFISGELLTAEEKRLLKAADRLSALIKCMEEQRSGNHEFDAALAQQKAALQAMHCPEADWFIEHCLPCYTQNLDELTRQQ